MGIATQIMLGIKGQDQTGEAFNSVAQKAQKTTSALKKMLLGATAGIGAVMIVRNAKQQIDEMSNIAATARQMGESGEYVQKLSGALGQVGIKGADMDSLATAFAKMTKETGAVGAKGFEDMLSSISQLGSEKERIEALSQTFGKSLGANLAPLVRQGPEAFREGLRDVMAAMPAVSDQATGMADNVSSALKLAGQEVKVAWQSVLGNILTWFGDTFGVAPGDAITMMIASVKGGVGAVWEFFAICFRNIGRVIDYFRSDWKSAMEWVLNGVKGYLKAVFDFWVQVFKSLGNVAVSFGKQLWSAIKGDGFDWSAIVDEATRELGKVGDKYKDIWKSLKPQGNEFLQFESLSSAADVYRKTMDTARKGIAAQAKLVSGTISESVTDGIEEASQKAVKAVKDASNKFTEAGSYEAMKLVYANAAKSVAGATATASPITPRHRTPGGANTSGNGIIQSILEVARNIDARLSSMDRRLAKVEVV